MAQKLTFGKLDGDRLVFGPLDVRPSDRGPFDRVNFVAAPIELWSGGSCIARLDDRNGIEALSLRYLREALVALRQRRRGVTTFGDHDFGQLVSMSANPDGTVAVQVTLPSEDVWDLELSRMEPEDLDRIIETIDGLEERFGDLTGYCEGCGIPQPTYYEA